LQSGGVVYDVEPSICLSCMVQFMNCRRWKSTLWLSIITLATRIKCVLHCYGWCFVMKSIIGDIYSLIAPNLQMLVRTDWYYWELFT
jgi:hypothetical protein